MQKRKVNIVLILIKVYYSVAFLTRDNEETIVPTQIECGAVIKSAASHNKHSLIQQYKENQDNINNPTKPKFCQDCNILSKSNTNGLKKAKQLLYHFKRKKHKRSSCMSTI